MANKMQKVVVDSNGNVMKKLSEVALSEIINDNGVVFFNGLYDSPHDIWDLVEDKKLKVPEAVKFLQLIRRSNIDKKNMIVTNKRKIKKAADILELGELMGLDPEKKTFVQETRQLVLLFKRLSLIAYSYNDKLQRPEHYVNPCYHKPAARLSLELYGLFRPYLFEAMTVKEIDESILKKKGDFMTADPRKLSSNSFRNAVEQAYMAQRVTTSQREDAADVLREYDVIMSRYGYVEEDSERIALNAEIQEEIEDARQRCLRDTTNIVETLNRNGFKAKMVDNARTLNKEELEGLNLYIVSTMAVLLFGTKEDKKDFSLKESKEMIQTLSQYRIMFDC